MYLDSASFLKEIRKFETWIINLIKFNKPDKLYKKILIVNKVKKNI